MLKEETRFGNSAVLEGITSLRAVFSGTDAGVNDRKILSVLLTSERKEKYPKEYQWLIHESARRGFALHIVEKSEIEEKSVGSTHGGLIAECDERHIPALTGVRPDLKENGFYAMIEGIEDPYNFGYALRSLYACGVDGIILPERNWLSAAGVVARSSAGASEMLPVYMSSAADAADYFHAHGYRIVCADTRTDALLSDTAMPLPLLLIVGGEKRGISRALLEKADTVVKIPYGREFPAALSAASATTMLAWEILRQNHERIQK